MSEQKQTLSIDGKELEFSPGETILEVARRNGIDIPTLCHLQRTAPTGACRMCVVEVQGARALVASCAMPAAPRMVVATESAKVVEARKLILQLLLASGNHNCLVKGSDGKSYEEYVARLRKAGGKVEPCPAWGDCRLQELAWRYGVTGGRFSPTPPRYPIEDVNPFIVRDFGRCILCGRCVQACNEIQVNQAIHFGYRGAKAKIIAASDRPYRESDCVFCGECLQVCPTGALTLKEAQGAFRPGETRRVRTTCAYCGVGCQQDLHVQDNRIVQVTGVAGAKPNLGSLCVKGRFGFDFVSSPERLRRPLIREGEGFREASWEEALDLVAKKLSAIRESSGPESLGVLSSARITNEENYVAQKFARAVLETNHIDHCARLCHASTVAGLAVAFGSGAMTNTIADLEEADVFLITGSNTTETHPVISTFIKRAVVLHGKKLIVVDPRRILIARYAERWLRPRPGTDVAWLNGMMHVILAEGLYNREFVEARTTGFEELKKTLASYPPEAVEKITGIPAAELAQAARLYARADRASIVYCMGITQHTTGTDNVKSLANLAMLCGHIGKPGTGVNPLRGQNNVQGACDMGALPDVFSGYQKVADENARRKMAAAWGTNRLPAFAGMKVTEMLPAARTGKIKGLYIIGENPAVSDADLGHVEMSLRALDFLVVQDIFLSETARLAHVVLPSACFAEKEGTFTNTERRVQRVRKAVEPPGEARPDWQILCDLASRLGRPFAFTDERAIFEEIRRVTPSYAGITYARIENEGLHWPCPNEEHPGTPILHREQFTIGKGVFHAIDYRPPAEVADAEYPLFLTTGRVLPQYHTRTMTSRTEGLNELAPESFVEISHEDARALGFDDGSFVRVASRRGSITARLKVSPKAVRGTVFIPFHYAQAAANRLTNAALDPVCGIPEFKVCAVRLEKAA